MIKIVDGCRLHHNIKGAREEIPMMTLMLNLLDFRTVVVDWSWDFVKTENMGRRILNDALRTIVNAERRGKATTNLKPISTVMTSFLKIMKDRGIY